MKVGMAFMKETDEFSEKFQKGGGVIFNPKKLHRSFWELKTELFDHKIDTK